MIWVSRSGREKVRLCWVEEIESSVKAAAAPFFFWSKTAFFVYTHFQANMDVPQIRPLDTQVINRIAAGEASFLF